MQPREKWSWTYRFLRVFALAVTAVLVVVSLIICVEQFWFRHRLEHLIADVRALEPGRSTSKNAKRVAEKWGFRDVSPQGQCSEESCYYTLQKQSPVSGILERLDGNLTVARVLILLGGRPVFVSSTIGLRTGAVRSIGLSLWVSAPQLGQQQYFLIGTAGMRGAFLMGGSDRSRPDNLLAASLRHEDYLVGKYTAISNADYGVKEYAPGTWVEFSPEADAKTIDRLMRFNLACITRLSSCRQADLMPEVWSEIAGDEQNPAASFSCTRDVIKRVAHLADIIAMVRVDSLELEPPPYPGSPFRLSNISLLKLLSGPDRFGVRLGAWTEVDNPDMMVTADTGAKVRAGQPYIFSLQQRAHGSHVLSALYPCGVLTPSRDNLDMLQHDRISRVE